MATQQLIDYIKQQKQQGIGDIEIKKALVSNGWPVSEIDKGFDLIQTPSFTPSFNRKNHFWLVSIIILCFMFGTSVLGYYLVNLKLIQQKKYRYLIYQRVLIFLD